jgi:phosphohistidine phosphatase
MKLLIVRHGIAMERDAYLANDDVRPLSLDGIRKMKKNARGLASIVETPTFLATSPLTRAKQTAEILQGEWSDIHILDCDALRPDTKPQPLATWINDRLESGMEFVVITGHEPHLSQVIQWMTGGMVELKKGGACLIDFDDRIARHRGRIQWLATPRFLRSL